MMRTLRWDPRHLRLVRHWMQRFLGLELQESTDVLLLETGDVLLGEMS